MSVGSCLRLVECFAIREGTVLCCCTEGVTSTTEGFQLLYLQEGEFCRESLPEHREAVWSKIVGKCAVS